MSNELFNLVCVDGEPRIYDLELAERLGFSEPRFIRKLIKRHFDYLNQDLGGLCHGVTKSTGGRPATEFYLNQMQAIFVCMKSDTYNATEITTQIVRIFDRYLRGDITLADEVVQKNEDPQDLEWLKMRIEAKEIRKGLSAATKPHQEYNQWILSTFTNTMYRRFFGLSAKQMKEELKGNPRDKFSEDQLRLISTVEHLASLAVKKYRGWEYKDAYEDMKKQIEYVAELTEAA